MGFEGANLTRTPFFLGTLFIIAVGWFLALIGVAITGGGAGHAGFTIAYTFVMIASIVWTVGNGVLYLYRFAILTGLAINVVLAITNAGYIYGIWASSALAGAGFIFITMVELLWIVVIGSDDSSFLYASVHNMTALPSVSGGLYGGQAVSAAHARPVDANAAHTVIAMQTVPAGVGQTSGNGNGSGSSVGMPMPHVPTAAVGNVPDVAYIYKARAKYAYTANAEDNTELSFGKDEVLEIADNKGKWWHARKADGSIGVVPSNYVELLGPNE